MCSKIRTIIAIIEYVQMNISTILVTKIVQGWFKLRDLAQHFDWKSLLEP
jgi:hypothetical protein